MNKHLKTAIELGLLPADGTHTQKLKVIGADFSRGNWLVKLVYDLYHKYGIARTECIIHATVGMELGNHGFGPTKMRAEWLCGLVHGLFLAENPGDIK